MFKPYEPTPMPVKVYRASDVGAPVLKNETGSLKTLLKTCLVNGYGEGMNRKEPLGWRMFEETANDVVFYSEKTQGIGLKIENSQKTHIKAYMLGGERFEQYLSYANRELNNFVYNHGFAMRNWLIVGCKSGFMLVLPQDEQNSQILYFGRLVGLYEDTGNIAYINTSYGASSISWDTGTFGGSNPSILTVRSQWRDGGTLPLSAVECEAFSPFSNTSVKYPDALYQNTTASAIVLAEKGGAVRGTLPALFWCCHNLQNVVDDLDFVPMADGQQYIKLNISDHKDGRYCFVLNVQEWVL